MSRALLILMLVVVFSIGFVFGNRLSGRQYVLHEEVYPDSLLVYVPIGDDQFPSYHYIRVFNTSQHKTLGTIAITDQVSPIANRPWMIATSSVHKSATLYTQKN